MGNNQSDGQNQFDTQGYIKISDREDDAIYGEIEVWNKNDNAQIKLAVSSNILHDEDHFAQAKEACDHSTKLQHESVVQLNNVIANRQEEFCSTFYQISLLYEYLEVNLKNDITQRFNANQHYNEDELWHILVSVISALAYLKQQGYQHSDIRPSSILINYEGKIKIMQRSWFQKKQDSYVEIITGTQSERGVYLSPKLIQNLKNSMLVPEHDTFKTDIYTLALTLIECAQLSPLADIYDLKRYQINNQVIKNSILQISARYSKQLVDFLSSMLEENEAQRPQIEELFQSLKNLFDQGIQMSDRLYTLNVNDKQFKIQNTQQNQPPQNVQQSPSPLKVDNITPVQQEDELHPIDAEHKKVKRSKKCKTDDHDKAKLSKQPVVEGLDPRKEKEYAGNKETDINRFHDESVENKKIKRKKAFNTDDHDQSTLTKEPVIGGVDPRQETKKENGSNVVIETSNQQTTQYVQKTYVTSQDKYPVTASFKSSSSKVGQPQQTQSKNF